MARPSRQPAADATGTGKRQLHVIAMHVILLVPTRCRRYACALHVCLGIAPQSQMESQDVKKPHTDVYSSSKLGT